MSSTFTKWDIVYPLRYPESIKCCSCSNHFTINPTQFCTHCGCKNVITNIIAKVRPMILWIDQSKWYKSMSFGIPLSTSGYFSDDLNHIIDISKCLFFEKKYEKPMRAVISQATRADGNVLDTKDRVGQLTDLIVRREIEDKLWRWLFV